LPRARKFTRGSVCPALASNRRGCFARPEMAGDCEPVRLIADADVRVIARVDRCWVAGRWNVSPVLPTCNIKIPAPAHSVIASEREARFMKPPLTKMVLGQPCAAPKISRSAPASFARSPDESDTSAVLNQSQRKVTYLPTFRYQVFVLSSSQYNGKTGQYYLSSLYFKSSTRIVGLRRGWDAMKPLASALRRDRRQCYIERHARRHVMSRKPTPR
jgi:hypothetical protein